MPQYNRAELGRMATESGFVRDTFEKVLRLKEILRFMNEDEFLREHLLLKGGTAINLTVFNLPRLSVDIDMDYTPNDTREDMLECREKITNVIKEYMESEGYLLSDEEGMKLYSLGKTNFAELAKNANAIRKVKGRNLVHIPTLEEYIETMCVE